MSHILVEVFVAILIAFALTKLENILLYPLADRLIANSQVRRFGVPAVYASLFTVLCSLASSVGGDSISIGAFILVWAIVYCLNIDAERS